MEDLSKIYDDFKQKTLQYSQFSQSNFLNKNESEKEVMELIHKNINILDNNPNLARDFFDLICNKNGNIAIRECLKYDLINYEPLGTEKTDNIDDLINICINTLKNFQYKVGGYAIEDENWILNNEQNCKRFRLKKNEHILYNSVGKNDYNCELEEFLKLIENYVKKFTNIIKISQSFHNDERHHITWIYFKFSKREA